MSRTIQIRNVPDDLYESLKLRAARSGVSLSAYLQRALLRITEEPAAVEGLSLDEWFERVRKREPLNLTAESIVEAIRAHRDA
jgi:antitoxin FitA